LKNLKKPVISIIIPVLNEEKIINSFIARLSNNINSVPHEIIVVDGSKNSKTVRSLVDPKIMKVSSRSGRGQQLNAGAKIATGEIFLFLHVDTLLPPFAVTNICHVFKENDVGAGAFDIAIDSNKLRYKILARMISIRSHIFKTPFGDQAHFFRREYFKKIGGYKNIKLMEDLEIMRRIRKQNDSIVILKEKVHTSPRRWEQEGIIRGILRNWFIRSQYYLGVHPDRLVKYYNK